MIRRFALFLLGLGLIAAAALCQAPPGFNYIVSTFAGTGIGGFAGDAGPASAAQLFDPWGMAFDTSGNLYIADQLNNRVRKVGTDGTITTVAGNGTAGYTGDTKAATSATLNHPTAVVVDASGNLYIADTDNHVVRKVDTSGNITTFAGIGSFGFAGDAAEATLAQLNRPIGLALDATGNLYIADSYNFRIRKVGTDGNINTIAGNGTAEYGGDGGPATDANLNYPQGVTLDAAGNLYIADTFNGSIRKVTTDGNITTVAGVGSNGDFGDAGPATQAALSYPKTVLVDSAGNLFIVDSINCRVRIVTASDGKIWPLAGDGFFGDIGDGGPAVRAEFRFPSGLLQGANGKLYLSDTQNNKIRLLTPTFQTTSPLAPPAINAGGVVSASSFGAFKAIAPGSWIEIYGANLASSTHVWTTADFTGSRAPTTLAGTRVTVGGIPAFLSYVSPTQINALVPSNVSLGQQVILVSTANGSSTPYSITVNATEPGLFAPPTFQVSGRQYTGALLVGTTAFVLPSGAVSGITSRPARPGDTIVLFGVGFGPVTPNTNAGEIAAGTDTLTTPIEIRLGGVPATITYRGLVPGAIGVYQFNVVVPQVAAGDAVPLTFTLGGQTGTQTVYTAVAN